MGLSINEFVKYLDVSLYPTQVEYLKQMYNEEKCNEHCINKFQFMSEE